MTSETEKFGALTAGLLDRLRQGETHVADMLWDIGQQLPEAQRKELETLVHTELDKQDQ